MSTLFIIAAILAGIAVHFYGWSRVKAAVLAWWSEELAKLHTKIDEQHKMTQAKIDALAARTVTTTGNNGTQIKQNA